MSYIEIVFTCLALTLFALNVMKLEDQATKHGTGNKYESNCPFDSVFSVDFPNDRYNPTCLEDTNSALQQPGKEYNFK